MRFEVERLIWAPITSSLCQAKVYEARYLEAQP